MKREFLKNLCSQLSFRPQGKPTWILGFKQDYLPIIIGDRWRVIKEWIFFIDRKKDFTSSCILDQSKNLVTSKANMSWFLICFSVLLSSRSRGNLFISKFLQQFEVLHNKIRFFFGFSVPYYIFQFFFSRCSECSDKICHIHVPQDILTHW